MIINLTEKNIIKNQEKQTIRKLRQVSAIIGTAARILTKINKPLPYPQNKDVLTEYLIQISFNLEHSADVLETELECPF